MNTKSIVLLLSIILMSSTSVRAQEDFHDSRHNHASGDIEKIRENRAIVIQEELGLTDAEAKEFIPILNEYMSLKFRGYKEYRDKYREFKKDGNKSDLDYNKALDCYLKLQADKESLEKDFYKKMRKVLPASKAYKYISAERKFMNNALNEHRNRKDKSSQKTEKSGGRSKERK